MRARWKVALSVLLAVTMALGLVPAPALAEMTGEVAAQGDGAAPTAGGDEGKAGEKTEAPGKDAATPKETGDSDASQPKQQVAAERARVEMPAAAEGLVYDGTEQAGVEAGEGYALSGDVRATDAGEYVAIATLQDGYEWADGTAEPREIRWSMARRPVTVAADDKSKLAGEADPNVINLSGWHSRRQIA